jgi:hypothetical protein
MLSSRLVIPYALTPFDRDGVAAETGSARKPTGSRNANAYVSSRASSTAPATRQ